MKTIIILLAGLTIATLICIGVFQLIRVLIQEMSELISEAWHIGENH